MPLDWISLDRIAIIIGILTGIGAIISSVYLLYKRLSRRIINPPTISFEVKGQHLGLGKGGILFTQKELILQEELVLEMLSNIFLSSSGSSTSVAFTLLAIEPNCIRDGVTINDIKITIDHRISQYHSPTIQENPYYTKPDETTNSLRLHANIPLSVSKIEKLKGSLYSLKELEISIAAEQTGRTKIIRTNSYKLKNIHDSIESDVASRIQHIQNAQLSAENILRVLRRYWLGE